jgi:hypothetical protein
MRVTQVVFWLVFLILYLNIGYLFGRFNLYVYSKVGPQAKRRWKILGAILWPLEEGLNPNVEWETAPITLVSTKEGAKWYLAGMALGGWWIKMLANLVMGIIIGIIFGAPKAYQLIILPARTLLRWTGGNTESLAFDGVKKLKK